MHLFEKLNGRRMEENQKRGARLKEALGDQSIASLAKRIGVGASTVHGYVHGKVPPADVAIRISDALGIDLRWYVTGEGQKAARSESMVDVPLLDADGRAYASVSYAESVFASLGVDPAEVRCVLASGTAMNPTVPEHAEVLFTPDPAGCQDGAAYVVSVRGRLVIRRVRVRAGGELEAVCDNVAFRPETADLLDPAQIVGRVLWTAHRV